MAGSRSPLLVAHLFPGESQCAEQMLVPHQCPPPKASPAPFWLQKVIDVPWKRICGPLLLLGWAEEGHQIKYRAPS